MNKRTYTNNLEKLITHGFEHIDASEKVEVSLTDLMYVYTTLQEYMRFFHQPMHYKSLDDVYKFLGTENDKAGFHILHTSIYKKMYDMFPDHIAEKFSNGVFDSPEIPFYFEPNK